VLAKAQGIDLWIVDAGIDADLPVHPDSSTQGAACYARYSRWARYDYRGMRVRIATWSKGRCRGHLSGIEHGRAGEMGIGNTASAALLMHGLTGIPLDECVGRGTGLDAQGLHAKKAVLASAWARRAPPRSPSELLSEFGGCEIAMLTGAALAAASRGMLVMSTASR